MVKEDNHRRRSEDELDQDLISELNKKYGTEEEAGRNWGHRRKALKMVVLLTVVVYLAVTFNNLFAVLSLPSLDFLDRSRELIQDEQVQGYREAVVEIRVGNSTGTGFNISKNGRIITNYHVVDNAGLITVRFPGGTPYAATVAKAFPEIDLAVIDIEGTGLPVIATASQSTPAPGDKVTIIGNPLGFSYIAVEGEVQGEGTLSGWDAPVLRIKAPIHRGNSGSPVINADGKVIAVIFATSTAATDNEIIGLAVPISQIYTR